MSSTRLRIAGGTARGLPLTEPRGVRLRHTSGMVRVAVFNIIADRVEGANVLVLYAGTGALGLEALSRGAAFALFMDDGAEARALLRQNVEALGLGGVSKVYRRDATRPGAAHPMPPFSLVFLDPPYGKGFGPRALEGLRDGGWLVQDALIVVEESKAAQFVSPDGFIELERRAYDDTEFVFLKFGAASAPPE